MSEYETHKGTIKRVFTDLTPKEFVLKLVLDEEVEVPNYYNLEDEEDFKEFCSYDLLEYGFVIYKDGIFSINNKEYEDIDTIFEYNLRDSDTVDYHFRFYNGGTCLSEMLEEVLEKISYKGDK